MSSDAAETIVLYDIPTKDPSIGTWGPNTPKAIYALQLKNLPFKIEWVEYPDIEPLAKRLGAEPTGTKPNFSGKEVPPVPHYTLPIIYDPRTKRAVSESFAIALYLDDTYPDSGVQLFPTIGGASTRALQAAFYELAPTVCVYSILPALVASIVAILPPRSSAYFRETRERRWKKPLEEVAPPGSQLYEECWAKLEAGLGKVETMLAYNSNGESAFMMGDTPSFADTPIAALVLWVRVCGSAEEWERFKGLHGGRWVRLAEGVEGWGK